MAINRLLVQVNTASSPPEVASENMDAAPEVAWERTEPMSEVMELKTVCVVNVELIAAFAGELTLTLCWHISGRCDCGKGKEGGVGRKSKSEAREHGGYGKRRRRAGPEEGG